jgi:hypothetical protein
MSWIGCVDELSDTRISGWAADAAGGSGPAQVDIIVNSRCVATVPCVTFREDLRLAGIGDGRKGFSFDPSAYLQPGGNALAVFYAGTEETLPKGRGRWVRRRRGAISDWHAAFLAALEAHFEFRPEHHVCAIGEGSEELEGVLRETETPFHRFTHVDAGDASTTHLAEKADLVVFLAWSSPVREGISLLRRLARDEFRRSGFWAIGMPETPDVADQIRQACRECGVPDVSLESLSPAEDGVRRLLAFAKAGGDAPKPEAGPVLAHIHLPKCAGTSFRVALERHFGPGHLSLYVNDTYFIYGDDALRSYLIRDPATRAFSSHHVREFPRWLAGREILYVTFLRDPIQQFVSYMTHIKKHYAAITSKSLLEATPPDAPVLPLREFARWLLSQDRDIPFRENHNVNFFARHSAPAAPDRLAAAKAALEGFFFVGITERMEESMGRLRALADAAGLEFPPDPLPVENTSADYRDDLSWINPGDEVGSLLLRSVEKDQKLYDWVMAKMDGVAC